MAYRFPCVVALLCAWITTVMTAYTTPQAPSNQSAARVNLGYAQYQGKVLRNGVSQYLGMRFAKEPTGDLRWRAPQEPDSM
jgi:hypothetical protein